VSKDPKARFKKQCVFSISAGVLIFQEGDNSLRHGQSSFY